MVGKSHLSDMSNDDRLLLYGLPYRVGIWMSHSDDEGGEDDDVQEAKALEKAIGDLAKAERVTPFVREVFLETLNHKGYWEEWTARSFDVLGDCERAVAVLEKHVSQEDRYLYKKALVNIASKVAGAHGEFGEGFTGEGLFDQIWNKLKSKLSGDKPADFMNTSAAEEASLHRLVTALHLKDKS